MVLGLGCRVWDHGLPLPSKDSVFSGFWTQRPHYVRLLGYFGAKAEGLGMHFGPPHREVRMLLEEKVHLSVNLLLKPM